MQTLTERVFRFSPQGGLYDETVIWNLFPERIFFHPHLGVLEGYGVASSTAIMTTEKKIDDGRGFPPPDHPLK